MKRILKWLVIIIASSGFIALIILFLVWFTPLPPIGEVKIAMKSLSKARTDKAGTYSKKLYSEAKADLDSAMVNWHRENEKFLFSRDYKKVKSYAQTSARKAKQAAENSISNSSILENRLKEKIDSLNETERSIDKLFGRYPLPEDLRTRISNGRLLLKEGELDYNKGQYLPANSKIAEAEYLLTGVYENTTAELKNYFKSYPAWKRLTQAAINDSKKNNSYAILVDKFSRKCYVYFSGIKKYEFDAELGRNWVGDKRRMGDKATPEGNYKIVNKFQGKETEYHKALSLDYPNKDDRDRFKAEISKGTLPASSKIGGGIEIHGGGGKGVDWTEGCIALTDSEIDIIFNLAKVGTQVTIVGSMKDIREILVK
jgi:L,D-peptidoglycan transpeptidase YkuD (ErfK/YbiS/YcfS/YnhG family)